eukprot:1168891-Pleurochrysis_carterae.AAC.2
MHSLESGMVVDDDQGVAATAVDGRLERTGDVDMYESTRIRRLPSRVRFGAGRTGRRRGMAEAARCIAGEVRKTLEVCPPAVQAAVHEVSGVARRHDRNVRWGP